MSWTFEMLHAVFSLELSEVVNIRLFINYANCILSMNS